MYHTQYILIPYYTHTYTPIQRHPDHLARIIKQVVVGNINV